ncbi:asparagine--tRNA ligase, partial [Legionella pneumophila]
KGQIDFSKDFFGRETFLTVSGQLNVEAYCMAMSKVYTFGPTFRAENSNTSRHLAEFWMIEPEIAFANLEDICKLSQNMLRYLCKTVLEERSDDMDFFNQFVAPGCIERMEHIADSEFEIMTYTDAIKA